MLPKATSRFKSHKYYHGFHKKANKHGSHNNFLLSWSTLFLLFEAEARRAFESFVFFGQRRYLSPKAPPKLPDIHVAHQKFQNQRNRLVTVRVRMPKSLAKVQKKVAKKKGNSNSLHENSRDAQKLRRAGARSERLDKVAAARAKANQPHCPGAFPDEHVMGDTDFHKCKE